MGMPEDFGDWGDEAFLNLCAEDWRDLAPRADAGEVMDRNLDSNFEDRFNVGEFDDYDPDRGDDWGQELDMADPDYSLGDDERDDYLDCEWED